MKSYDAEGIGSLESNRTARVLESLFKVLAYASLAVVGFVGVVVWSMQRNWSEPPWELLIPGLVAFLGVFIFAGLRLVVRRLFYPGDWYDLLEHGAGAEKHGEALEAARALLKLTGTDLLTYKLKAKAHLYLGFYLIGDAGAGHWGALLKLLASILEQDPRNANFRLDRAQAYQRVKNYDKALEDLEILVTAEHPNLRAHSIKISCLTSMNRLDDARLACERLESLIWRFPKQSEVTLAVSAHRAELLQRGGQVVSAPAQAAATASTRHSRAETPRVASEIHDAAQHGEVAKVRALLKDNPDLAFSKDAYGDSPLHEAARAGHKNIAELLLANNADVNAKRNDGLTPLQLARLKGHKDVVEVLRQHGGHK